jgi:hypothetical protein
MAEAVARLSAPSKQYRRGSKMTVVLAPIQSEDALFDFLRKQVIETETRKPFPKRIVDSVSVVLENVPNGMDTWDVRAKISGNPLCSMVQFVYDELATGKGTAACYPAFVQLAGRVLDEFNIDFVSFAYINRLLIEVLGLENQFDQVRRNGEVWLVEGPKLRRLGIRVELKQEGDYEDFRFPPPLDEDVLELL